MTLFELIIEYLIAPILLWAIWVTVELIKLKATQITKDDLREIHNRLDLILSDLHNK